MTSVGIVPEGRVYFLVMEERGWIDLSLVSLGSYTAQQGTQPDREGSGIFRECRFAAG